MTTVREIRLRTETQGAPYAGWEKQNEVRSGIQILAWQWSSQQFEQQTMNVCEERERERASD